MDSKNVLLAVILSSIVLVVWATFFEPPATNQKYSEKQITKTENSSSPSIDKEEKGYSYLYKLRDNTCLLLTLPPFHILQQMLLETSELPDDSKPFVKDFIVQSENLHLAIEILKNDPLCTEWLTSEKVEIIEHRILYLKALSEASMESKRNKKRKPLLRPLSKSSKPGSNYQFRALKKITQRESAELDSKEIESIEENEKLSVAYGVVLPDGKIRIKIVGRGFVSLFGQKGKALLLEGVDKKDKGLIKKLEKKKSKDSDVIYFLTPKEDTPGGHATPGGDATPGGGAAAGAAAGAEPEPETPPPEGVPIPDVLLVSLNGWISERVPIILQGIKEKWFSLKEWERSLMILMYDINIPSVLGMELGEIYSKLIDNPIILENYYEYLNLSCKYEELDYYPDEHYRGHQSTQLEKFKGLLEGGVKIGKFKTIFRKSRFKTNIKDQYREPELQQGDDEDDEEYDEGQLYDMIEGRKESEILKDLSDFIENARKRNKKYLRINSEKFLFIKIVVFTKFHADGGISYYQIKIDKTGDISIHDKDDNSVIDSTDFFQTPITITCNNYKYQYDGSGLEILQYDFKLEINSYIMCVKDNVRITKENGDEVTINKTESFIIVEQVNRDDSPPDRYKVVTSESGTERFYINYIDAENPKYFKHYTVQQQGGAMVNTDTDTSVVYIVNGEYKLSDSRVLYNSTRRPMMISDYPTLGEFRHTADEDDGRLGLERTDFNGDCSGNKLVFKSLLLENKELYSIFDLKNEAKIIIEDLWIKVKVANDIILCSPQVAQAAQAGQAGQAAQVGQAAQSGQAPNVDV